MKKIFNLFIGALLLTTACTNLDETLYSEMSKDEFLASGDNLALYTSTPYTRLQEWAAEQGYWTLVLQLGNEMAVPKAWDGTWSEPRYTELQTHNIPSNNKLVLQGWNYCFNGIAACNDALYEIEKAGVSGDDANRTIAEIKVLRAYYYLMAIDLWGDVPYSVDKAATEYPKPKSRKEMYSFIETEINTNISYLSEVPGAATYGRVTQDVARFILAKLYLNAKVYIGEEKWAEAADACLDIIKTGHFSLTATYKENFEVYNQNSSEAIFAIPYSNIYTPKKFYIYVLTLNADLEEVWQVSGTWTGSHMGQPDFLKSYEVGDTRLEDTWLFGDIYTTKGKRVQYQSKTQTNPETGEVEPVYEDMFLEAFDIPESKFKSGIDRTQGARIQKWTYQDGGILKDYSVSMENDFILMRYSDVILMYAEALLRDGKALDNYATDGIRHIRERAGLEMIQDIDLEKLFIERQHELALEGWVRNDLVRFDKYLDAWWAKPAGEEYMKLLPIPEEIRGSNTNLGQNVGY